MTLTWRGTTVPDKTLTYGPLALIVPMLQKLDVQAIIDRHLPPDPQLAYSHGRVLSLLLAARLHQPTALSNVAEWAERTGADAIWDIPAEDLNDDRLGRALDAFFSQRHSIQAAVAAQALQVAELSPDQLHFDTTHVLFYGAYESSQSRQDVALGPPAASADVPPAHITHGHGDDAKLLQVGVTSVVDELGAVPLLAQCLDGNNNGYTAIEQQVHWLKHCQLLQPGRTMVSDRGTFSVEHVARLNRHGCHVLCPVPWSDYQWLYDAHAEQLQWQRASYLSQEQQRRRQADSSLAHEHYELAVIKHALTDSQTQKPIDCRVIFVFSTADQAICRRKRAEDVERFQTGLAEIAKTVARGHRATTQASIAKRVSQLFGNREAARFFRWEMVPLSAEERAALPPKPRSGHQPSHRFHYEFDQAAAQAAQKYDGLAALLTTVPKQQSCDALFTQYKQQNYVELGHHQWKTPIAVRPIFLKSPARVEALVCLLQLALTTYQLIERCYRQSLSEDAPKKERRRTTENLFRTFTRYGLIERRSNLGRVVHATFVSSEQSRILRQLGFPTPTDQLAQVLSPLPLG